LFSVELQETLQHSSATSASFENLPEIQLSNGARTRFQFPVAAAGNSSGFSAGLRTGRRRRRSSSITPLQVPSIHVNEGEERLREMRRTISARPQTSNLYSPVIESSDDEDDEEIVEALEDVSDEEDLNVFEDSDGSDWDLKSKRIHLAVSNEQLNLNPR
jgi:tRNA/tmRNA/rRNA uracil-C5-methylase (TrmA/RlmC/RlmD family)